MPSSSVPVPTQEKSSLVGRQHQHCVPAMPFMGLDVPPGRLNAHLHNSSGGDPGLSSEAFVGTRSRALTMRITTAVQLRCL